MTQRRDWFPAFGFDVARYGKFLFFIQAVYRFPGSFGHAGGDGRRVARGLVRSRFFD